MIIPNFQTIMLFLPKQIQNRKAYKIDGKQLTDLKIDFNLAQAINYLEAYNLQTGLLINFDAKSLLFKRLFNKKYKPQS